MLSTSASPDGRVNLANLMSHLSERGMRSIMVEGGVQVIRSLMAAQLVDYLVVTICAAIHRRRTRGASADGVVGGSHDAQLSPLEDRWRPGPLGRTRVARLKTRSIDCQSQLVAHFDQSAADYEEAQSATPAACSTTGWR